MVIWIIPFKKLYNFVYNNNCSVSSQLEAEASHRAITIGNRVSVLCGSILIKMWELITYSTILVFLQANCPVYLVNVSSMGAGDVVATAKMQGRRVPSLRLKSLLANISRAFRVIHL